VAGAVVVVRDQQSSLRSLPAPSARPAARRQFVEGA